MSAEPAPTTDGDRRQQLVFSVIQSVGPILAATLVTKLVSSLWARRRGHAPPTDPSHDDVTWVSAITWAAGVGAMVGVTKLFTRRTAARSLEGRVRATAL